MTIRSFDLHGRVRLDLVDPPAAAVERVRTETGLADRPAGAGAAALTVRFDLRLTEPARWVGRDAAFCRDMFLLGPPGQRTAFPTDAVDGDTTLHCEPEVRDVPHLLTLLNLGMARSGCLPLHAGAVTVGERTLVTTAWAHGGKTSAVLGLMALGGTFVADEWCYADPDGTVLGLSHPISLSTRQLSQAPGLRRGLSRKQRLRLAAAGRLAGSSLLDRAVELRTDVPVPPARLFPPERIRSTGRLDLLVLAECSDDPEPTARRIPVDEAAARVRAVLRAERAELAADLARMQYAFPGSRALGSLDAVDAREAELLRAVLHRAGSPDGGPEVVPTWLVTHPHPADLVALGRCLTGIEA